jgi:hypothetical protein
MLQVKQAKEEERQKERRWAFLHRLERKGVTFVAGGGVERGSAGLSRSTRRDITWPINTSCTTPGGTAGVLGVMVMPYHSEHPWGRVGAVWCAAMGCLRPCRRSRRAPARHIS